jgi:hypothetical protein
VCLSDRKGNTTIWWPIVDENGTGQITCCVVVGNDEDRSIENETGVGCECYIINEYREM